MEGGGGADRGDWFGRETKPWRGQFNFYGLKLSMASSELVRGGESDTMQVESDEEFQLV